MKRLLVSALALLAAGCARESADALLQGYGEADYIYLASQEAGVLRELNVREGDAVDVGAQLFNLEPDRLELNVESANSQSAAAAQAVNTAQAEAILAQNNYARGEELFARGFYPRARLESDRAALAPGGHS